MVCKILSIVAIIPKKELMHVKRANIEANNPLVNEINENKNSTIKKTNNPISLLNFIYPPIKNYSSIT
ncbi:hypothetical protein [Escherichia phage CLB_P2]|nr:hypothetical protein [Escherichia phage CLB_P2]